MKKVLLSITTISICFFEYAAGRLTTSYRGLAKFFAGLEVSRLLIFKNIYEYKYSRTGVGSAFMMSRGLNPIGIAAEIKILRCSQFLMTECDHE